jgi:small subunit ribosomal protein S1
VLDIDASNERLSLGIKQLTQDPWDTISQRYPVGTRVHGTITSVTDFGLFVEIESGVEGLIHNSQLGSEKIENIAETFKIGSQIESEVTNIDREERRISLSIKAIRRRNDKEQLAEFMEEGTSAVTFGDLLRRKMDGDEN